MTTDYPSSLYPTEESLLRAANKLSEEALDYLEVVFMHSLDAMEEDPVLQELRDAGFVDSENYVTELGKWASALVFG